MSGGMNVWGNKCPGNEGPGRKIYGEIMSGGNECPGE